MFDKIGDFIADIGENVVDLGERSLEKVGLMDKPEAWISVNDGKLSHNIDLSEYSSEQQEEIESMLRPFANELEAIEAELEGDVDPGRAELLRARRSEIEQSMTDVKWELERQQFNFGKAFFGSIILGGGLLAQPIGFDGGQRMQSAAEILTPSAEELGVSQDVSLTGKGNSPAGDADTVESDETAGETKSNWVQLESGYVNRMMDMITRDPEALLAEIESMPTDQRMHVMQMVQQNLQELNRMHTMMTNFNKAVHDTQKAVLNNFRV